MKIKNSSSLAFQKASSVVNEDLKAIPHVSQWPDAWIKIQYKEYPRFDRIPIRISDFTLPPFNRVLASRRSVRSFSKRGIFLDDMSKLVCYSAGIRNIDRRSLSDLRVTAPRFYPSAGTRYPSELYFLVLKATDLPRAIYHFNVKRNSLERLFELEKKNYLSGVFADKWVSSTPVIIVLSSVFLRTQVKYGERGYRYALMEIGHLAQNVMLIAHAMGLASCPIGGFIDHKLNELIDLDGESESAMLAIAIGHPKRSNS
jgi:SagB-type dehydrogenase family enzyme